jgi:hypothetical protein
MGDKQPKDKPQLRKPYTKPVVKKVNLRPEEAVLGSCKTSSSAGPAGGTCTALGPCTTAGS